MISEEKFVTLIRKLAKSNRWQTLYTQFREGYGLKLFENETNFTFFQILFLNKLNFYSTIYLDIAMGEINEIVLDKNIYEDSYVHYKYKKDDMKQNKPQDTNNMNTTTWVFKKPKKAN